MRKQVSTLIEFFMVKACHSYNADRISTPQTREGIGGEKAAGEAASLPVPNNHQTPHRPVIAPQQSLRSASGEVEQKREWVFPQKSGIYAYRAPRGDCDHRDSRLDAAAGVESGA